MISYQLDGSDSNESTSADISAWVIGKVKKSTFHIRNKQAPRTQRKISKYSPESTIFGPSSCNECTITSRLISKAAEFNGQGATFLSRGLVDRCPNMTILLPFSSILEVKI